MSANRIDSLIEEYDRPVKHPPDPFGRGDVYDDSGMDGPEALQLGRLADSPLGIPWIGWKRVLRRTAHEMISDKISLVAAGCAFWGTLALFPAISMLVAIYGLVFDAATAEPHMALLRDLLPPSAFHLIEDRVHELVNRPPMMLTRNLALSTGVTLWSAATGTKSMLAALNLAYEERERRKFMHFQLVAFAMTMLGLIGAAIGMATLVGLPSAFMFVGLTKHTKALVHIASLAGVVGFVVLNLSLLYRFGPSRTAPRWQWVTPGAVVATILWLVVSLVFSFYVGHLSTYDTMYGSIGAVAGVMMWFFVTVYVVLLGAELNAELELQTARDSTGGKPRPIGYRGAYVADHVARN